MSTSRYCELLDGTFDYVHIDFNHRWAEVQIKRGTTLNIQKCIEGLQLVAPGLNQVRVMDSKVRIMVYEKVNNVWKGRAQTAWAHEALKQG